MPAAPDQRSALAHALRVLGGAVGMVLVVVGTSLIVADAGDALAGCTRCGAVTAGGVAALLMGVWLVRSAWRAMRTDAGSAHR